MLMVATVATTGTTYAQYVNDAIRTSRGDYGSSARFKGMGNAQIGVGGDMSSLGGNPAGLGLFTRSEFSLTPEFNNATSKSDYLEQKGKGSSNKFNINQAGVVWYNPTYKYEGQDTRKGVLSVVFGIGFNRNGDYTQDYQYNGTNSNTSMRDFFAEEANRLKDINGNLSGSSLANMAFETFLINRFPSSSGGTPIFSADPFSSNTQRMNSVSYGGTSELNFAGALNISNQLYLGATIGMVNTRFINDSEYTENGVVNTYIDNPTPPELPGYLGEEKYNFSYTTHQETKGSGINGKLGLIYRPIGNFKIGATFQTPTWYYVEDYYAEDLLTSLSGSIVDNPFNPMSSTYSYRLKTPTKGSLGASYVFAGQGMISADVDFIDYSTTKFSMDGGGPLTEDMIYDNNYIKNSYTSAVNYRVGGEYKIADLSLRAGFGLNGTPFKDDKDKIYETKYYTGGLGYRINEYYFDIAYQRVQSENRLSPYVLNDHAEPTAAIKNANNNVFLTFGVRF